MEFLVDEATASSHPLHVAGADAPTGASGVLMFHLALIDDGDGFEAAMRMLTHAARPCRRLEGRRCSVVEHQEWTELASQTVVTE
jgi:hypothetical protein